MISIIIPSYNRSHTLSGTIKSVLQQSDGNWELIIVDDGSLDSTSEVVQKYLGDGRVKYYFQDHSGVSAARNYGASLAKGNYLIFLDSDDQLYPDLIKHLKLINYSDYDFINWQVRKLKGDNEVEIWKPAKLEKIYNHITASFLAGSICYRKEIFQKAGGYDSKMKFGENYELGLRIAQINGLKTKILDKVYLDYFLKSAKRQSADIEAKIQSNQHLYRKHRQLYLKDSLSHGRLIYLFGYLYQQKGNKEIAYEYYKKAWKINPMYLKPMLKVSYLKLSFLIR
ncbi:glycosyltransferase [Pontixanthobacter gangjinensis]|uniref:glycosyltransferase family 2 protein n=1 Tax=Christiangramia aestuarii TaxID=1028746 RepID=UPI0012E2C9D3|nr:glycosyltransferase family 2 protein [Christiangramia aestuarii]